MTATSNNSNKIVIKASKKQSNENLHKHCNAEMLKAYISVDEKQIQVGWYCPSCKNLRRLDYL